MKFPVTKDTPQAKLTVGCKYRLDEGFSNSSIVWLRRCLTHFCEVEDIETGQRWETMTNRLTELNSEFNETISFKIAK